ncbi:hypothetical protein ACFC08_17850 [Streptomyces sp. NPDC056112]|uniref:hypothetical protein n=1 Tax=Streptomyces sp. NPDC056112 TaxID=3345715 RepID=UPI0035DDF4D3
MTESLEPIKSALISAVREISDAVERYQTVKEIEIQLGQAFKEVKAEAAKDLHEDHSWSQVGQLLGVTGARAEQISRGAR